MWPLHALNRADGVFASRNQGSPRPIVVLRTIRNSGLVPRRVPLVVAQGCKRLGTLRLFQRTSCVAWIKQGA
jgi:hypothetical protein